MAVEFVQKGRINRLVAGTNITLSPASGEDGEITITAAGGSTAWGGVTGTLANQTDLDTALNGKQPLDADLTTIAGLTATTDNFIVSAASAWASRTPAQAKTSLALVKADVSLGSVDNTSDAGKPVSTATQTALDAKEATANKDATGGYTGLTLFKINFKNAANTFINFLTNATTAARTYTFPDKDITVAGLVDITGTNSGTNTGDNATNSQYSGLVSNATHTGDATGATALTVVKINGTTMSALATGILKNTTTTGVPSIAVNSDLPAMSATVGGAVPTPPNNTTTFLRGDGTFAAPTGGAGDMILASAQTNSGVKTFLDTTMKLRNVANTFDGSFVNTNTASRVYTLKDAAGTLAFTTDITGTNSGTNTGDQTLPVGGTPAIVLGTTNTAGVSPNFLRRDDTVLAFDATAPSTQAFSDAAVVGVATVTARRDHKHAMMASPTITLTGDVTGSGTGSFATTFKVSPSFTTPILGVATGTSLATTGAQTSSGGGIGYATGAGGAVTQLTSRATTVVLNKLCGNITMFSAAQAANAIVTFTLTNSFIAATDFVGVQHISATNGGAWVFSVVAGAGSCTISIANSTAASITSATPLRFIVLKSVTS